MCPTSPKNIALGIRLHNPGNIRYSRSSARFLGCLGEEKGFCKFESDKYGIRAIMVLIRNYMKLHSLRTIPEIITRYAPPSENSTDNYIKLVSQKMGKFLNMPQGYFPVDVAIYWQSTSFFALVRSIMLIECNFDCTEYELMEAYKMLDVSKPNNDPQ